MSKPEVRIENWYVVVKRIHGDAYGHPRFDDGTAVVTSVIEKPKTPYKEGDVVETRNTLYTLGKPATHTLINQTNEKPGGNVE